MAQFWFKISLKFVTDLYWSYNSFLNTSDYFPVFQFRVFIVSKNSIYGFSTMQKLQLNIWQREIASFATIASRFESSLNNDYSWRKLLYSTYNHYENTWMASNEETRFYIRNSIIFAYFLTNSIERVRVTQSFGQKKAFNKFLHCLQDVDANSCSKL